MSSKKRKKENHINPNQNPHKELLKYILLADDTNLYCFFQSLHTSWIQRETFYKKCFDLSNLSPNKKIEYIIFSDSQTNNEVNIMMNNVEIETKIKNVLESSLKMSRTT